MHKFNSMASGLVLGALLGAVSLTMLAVPASATLHGYCAPAATQCVDNGTISPTSINPPSNFGFTTSPGPASGTLFVDVLVPNNEDTSPSTLSFGLTGTLAGTVTLFSTTPWTTGQLDAHWGSAPPHQSDRCLSPVYASTRSGGHRVFCLPGKSRAHYAPEPLQSECVASGEHQPPSSTGVVYRRVLQRKYRFSGYGEQRRDL